MTAIVGRWKIYKIVAVIDGECDMFSREKVEEDLKKQLEEGDISEMRMQSKLAEFGTIIEFTPDYKMKRYDAIPEGAPKEWVDKQVADGEFTLVNGLIYCGEDCDKPWKAEDGDYWYKENEECSWEKITPDSDGRITMELFVLERA